MKLIFDTHGNNKQKEAARHWINNEVSDICYGGAKAGGKSYLGCSLIFGDAFIYPNTHYFIARKELNDLRKYTVPSIYEVFEHWGIPQKMYRYDGKDNFFEISNRSHVFLIECAYKPQDPKFQRFGSMQMTRGWIEEAGEIHVGAKNNLSACVGRWKNDEYGINGKIIQTCNPSKNYLYREYYKKFKDGTIESWKRFVQALPEDNKKLASGYLENLRRSLSANEKERLLFGNWEYDDDPLTLCGYEQITDIFTNQFVPGGNKYITADVARFGADSIIIRVWDGWRVTRRVKKDKLKVPETAGIIRDIANQEGIPMSRTIVDEDGVGGGVVDLLSCIGFVANSRPIETGEYDAEGNDTGSNFDMLKSQCGFKLADRINSHQVYENAAPEVQELIIEQLEQLKQKAIDVDKKKGLMPKEKIKEAIGYSPDDMDTYIMRAYFDIKKPSTPAIISVHR